MATVIWRTKGWDFYRRWSAVFLLSVVLLMLLAACGSGERRHADATTLLLCEAALDRRLAIESDLAQNAKTMFHRYEAEWDRLAGLAVSARSDIVRYCLEPAGYDASVEPMVEAVSVSAPTPTRRFVVSAPTPTRRFVVSTPTPSGRVRLETPPGRVRLELSPEAIERFSGTPAP